jgi:hypothetical protein
MLSAQTLARSLVRSLEGSWEVQSVVAMVGLLLQRSVLQPGPSSVIGSIIHPQRQAAIWGWLRRLLRRAARPLWPSPQALWVRQVL